jgi:endonuclease III
MATPRAAGKKKAKPKREKKKPVARPRKRPKAFRGAALETQAREVVTRLRHEYPDAHTELDFRSPYELLVATILSAQTTDVRVNLVTPALFERFPMIATLADADPAVLETIIRSTGFFHAKTKSLIGMATAVMTRFGGVIPETMAELVTLPGVGRKTANVVLGNAFHRDEGIVVDTHVTRLSQRLGLTAETDPVKIEQGLMRIVPRDDWTMFSHLLIFHGRRVCTARAPAHDRCVLATICPSATLV